MDDSSKEVKVSDNAAREIFDLLESEGIMICEDLHFLVLVSLTVEYRSIKWQRRSYDALKLALKINLNANKVVNPEQLAAASLAHDFAMGFLPSELINKVGNLNAKERKLMQTHITAASDLIHRLRKWESARHMILAHHEHIDGNGYPKQLSDMEICDGAKILAIVDAFTAQGQGNVMHGVMEINRHSGTQFSEFWLEHFNAAVKEIHQAGSNS